MYIDFLTIIRYAWMDYDASRGIKSITDISVMVSTNHVYKVVLEDKTFVIAKLAYYGKYDHFKEDHNIVNVFANNLPYPYENFLSRSLMLGNDLFVHRFKNNLIDAWVVFYRPIKIKNRIPKILNEEQIKKLGVQFALFHKASYTIRNTLPKSTKTLNYDIDQLLNTLDTEEGKYEYGYNIDNIKWQSELFKLNTQAREIQTLPRIPVFVDWNSGNFSVTHAFKLYSRWDYDWFRTSSRMLDFYFFARLVSSVGDKTVFSYNVEPLLEDRFKLFLKSYHEVYPLTEIEVRLLKEAYRFFILNYVIKDGRYFFHEIYASKLQQEAYEVYFPSIDRFNPEELLKYLKI